MEESQRIHCSVTSCKYNNEKYGRCVLESIEITPMPNVRTKKPDESMCSSYEFNQ